jgi:hypothetical protein
MSIPNSIKVTSENANYVDLTHTDAIEPVTAGIYRSRLSNLWAVFLDGDRLTEYTMPKEEALQFASDELVRRRTLDYNDIYRLAVETFPAGEYTSTGTLLVLREAFTKGYIAAKQGKRAE